MGGDVKMHLPHLIPYGMCFGSMCPAYRIGTHPILYDDRGHYKDQRTNANWLFNLTLDPTESYDIARTLPVVEAQVASLAALMVARVAENPRGWTDGLDQSCKYGAREHCHNA